MIVLLSKEELEKIPTLVLPEIAILAAKEANAVAGYSCAHCEGFRPDPQVSGNLQVDPEIHLPSPGMDVDIAYYYNAVSTSNGPFGYGRTLSQSHRPRLRLSRLRHPHMGNGALVSYQYDGSVME